MTLTGPGPGPWRTEVQTPGPRPQRPYRYTESVPSRATSRLVLSYWSFQSDDAPPPDERYTVFPDGCASIAYVRPLSGPRVLALVGPRVSPLYPPVYRGSRIWGVRLWPDAIGPVLGLEARTIRNHFGALPVAAASRLVGMTEALPASDDPDLVFPALEARVTVLLEEAPDPDPRVRAAIRAIVARRGEGSMEDVARTAAIGLRHLQRIFPEATGLTLREYARVRRLREALALRLTPGSPNWSAIAADTGFVDHSHLTREFVALAGIAPSLAANQLQTTVHLGVRP
jgi:AraC-like DNA-binding protein